MPTDAMAPIAENSLLFGFTWSKRFCNWNSISLPGRNREASSNLIVGMATGASYTFDKLTPFCKSVRMSGFQGEVVIGISKLRRSDDKRRKQMFDKFDITGVHLNGIKGNGWAQSICRYHAYLQLILHFANQNDSILVSDVRDVFFQADPFNSSPFGSVTFINSTSQLLLFSEGLNDISKPRQTTLRNTRGNFRWLVNIYGLKKSNSLRERPVLCSGTTMGTKSGMIYYTRAMLYEAYECLKRNPNKFDGKRGHVCSGGADQGFHNYLFWNFQLNASVALSNAAGPVYTIGIFRGKPIRSLNFDRNLDGDIISPPERGPQYVVPVIHQWDRHDDLLKHVFNRFGLQSEGVSVKLFSSNLLKGGFSGKQPKNSRGL